MSEVSLNVLLFIISAAVFIAVGLMAYYFAKEAILSWRYGHAKDAWSKESLLESLHYTNMMRRICVFMMGFFVLAPVSVYLIERGSIGGSLLATCIIAPAIGVYVLQKAFAGEARRIAWLLANNQD